ncbi:MAG TPA: type III ribulose-bisphosphate carboxylase, partial [Euryarchaeota archaeon]|nr:type III ribulose-bisphosphate carboxylase [Euryarchaeota archaeon]
IRLEDLDLPEWYLRDFRGPGFGVGGVRAMLDVRDRPITATVPKPKVGHTAEEYAEVAYLSWIGGIDLVKDDENLTDQGIARFEERLKMVMRARERAEKETGERKSYLVNITGETEGMRKRARLVSEYGNEYVMIDILTCGWSAFQTMREETEELGLAIHAHRAMHAAFTRDPRHGISMFVLAKLMRTIGMDQLHVGTAGAGKLEGGRWDVIQNAKILRDECYAPGEDDLFHLEQRFYHIKPAFPVSSGGLHPGNLPAVIDALGTEIVLQLGGGTLGHPDGPRAGATAVRQALDAIQEGVPLKEYAKSHRELSRALEKWGEVTPI